MVQLKGGETCIADESGEQQGLAGGGGRVFRALGHAFGFRTFIPKEEKKFTTKISSIKESGNKLF